MDLKEPWGGVLLESLKTVMRIVLFGPPGVGKGTQADLLAKRRGLKPISTGELIRAAIKAGTPLGMEAKAYADAGQLVPGCLVRTLAEEAIAARGFADFALDGYPRTVEQAGWLHAFLAAHEAPLHAVIRLIAPVEVIVSRLSKRRVHKVTGATYHLDFKPPPPDVDPALIIQRPDDCPKAIRRRLQVYMDETKPVLDYYRAEAYYFEIDGAAPFETVYKRIERVLQPASVAEPPAALR
jgi:adenylate kinase